jgi:hypothetical protein
MLLFPRDTNKSSIFLKKSVGFKILNGIPICTRTGWWSKKRDSPVSREEHTLKITESALIHTLYDLEINFT